MPAATLSDEELAAVMGHVLTTFNKVSQPPRRSLRAGCSVPVLSLSR
jgi:hypothetical protein